MKIVIVGGGVAAFEAALSAGKAGVPCEITLISREKVFLCRSLVHPNHMDGRFCQVIHHR